MRYSIEETTTLVGLFDTGLSVTIKVIDLNTDTLIDLTTNVCTESSNIPGVYLFSTSNINLNVDTGIVNLLYEMIDENGKKYYGKFSMGGYIDDELLYTLNVINGRI